MGLPGKVIRQTTNDERKETVHLADKYGKLAHHLMHSEGVKL